MKMIVAAALIALAFTTGFTCSKNAPQAEAPVAAPVAPAEGQVAPPADAAAPAAAPTEAAPAAPATETK